MLHQYTGLDFNASGGYTPPDTAGAAGPAQYVETVNQTIALYASKTAGGPSLTAPLDRFYFNTGGLPQTDAGSGLSDPIVAYDEQIGRFIVGDQDVDFTTHLSSFDIAVSKTSTPGSLSAIDWNFYRIVTTEAGFDADYPGNFGYNHDAFVFTLNMFGVAGGIHVQVNSVNAGDLANGAVPPPSGGPAPAGIPSPSSIPTIGPPPPAPALATPAVFSSSPGNPASGTALAPLRTFQNDVAGASLRPTTMHDAVAGDPMWLISESGTDASIVVMKMSNVLSNSASFTTTVLAVAPYQPITPPLNPDGSIITSQIDSRILKSAESNNSIVTTHAVAAGATRDVAQWYQIDVSSGTPALTQQGRVSAGANTYVYYPGIDINSSGQIGMSFMRSGTDRNNDFMSMYVTVRAPNDAPGTMQTPILVPAGTGQANYSDFAGPNSRAGDLSGINVDPIDGTFWAANEFANQEAGANWGTAIANFSATITLPAPQNVQAVALSPTTAQVTWDLVQGADLGYQVFMVSGGNILVGSVGAGINTVVATGLTPGVVNTLFVRALSSTIPPGFADSASITLLMPAILTAPQNVSAAVITPTAARVAWDLVQGADLGYQVFLVSGGNILVGTVGAGTNTVVATGLNPGVTDTLFVRALSSTVTPFFADSATITIVMPPNLVTPIVTVTVTSQNTATLNWGSVAGADGYRIYEKIGSRIFLVGYAGPSTTSLKLVGLTHGQTVQFMVEAYFGFVFSDSSWVDVTT